MSHSAPERLCPRGRVREIRLADIGDESLSVVGLLRFRRGLPYEVGRDLGTVLKVVDAD